MSNGLRPSAALRTAHSSRRAAAPLLGEERFGIIRLEFTPRVHPKSQGEMTEMGEPFRVSDLLDTLIRLEERGSAFYGDLAARTKSERARKLFEQLGGEEREHRNLYAALKSKFAEEEVPGPERIRHLDTLIRQSFAFEEFRPILKDTEKAWQQALDFAIRLEKDTASYVREIRSILRPEAPEVFEAILAEEERHLKLLQDYRNQSMY